MSATKQIICIKWGSKYGAEYANRLYGMIERNITPPFSVTVFTDDSAGLRSELQHAPIPRTDIVMPKGVPGKWPKSALWGPELAGLEGPVLFMDLDVVITGSLDVFFEYGHPNDVVLARNAAKPLHRLGQTSIFRFPAGKLTPILDLFRSDPQRFGDKYRYEQNFVTKNAPGGVSFWPRAWVRHFRIQCVPTFPFNLFREPRRPKDARVVIFAGHLNPPDAIAGRWNRKQKARSLADHLRHVWQGKLGYKGLRSYLKPTSWVEENWRE